MGPAGRRLRLQAQAYQDWLLRAAAQARRAGQRELEVWQVAARHLRHWLFQAELGHPEIQRSAAAAAAVLRVRLAMDLPGRAQRAAPDQAQAAREGLAVLGRYREWLALLQAAAAAVAGMPAVPAALAK